MPEKPAELREIPVWLTVSVPVLPMPPPLPSAALPETVARLNASFPLLKMPCAQQATLPEIVVRLKLTVPVASL